MIKRLTNHSTWQLKETSLAVVNTPMYGCNLPINVGGAVNKRERCIYCKSKIRYHRISETICTQYITMKKKPVWLLLGNLDHIKCVGRLKA